MTDVIQALQEEFKKVFADLDEPVEKKGMPTWLKDKIKDDDEGEDEGDDEEEVEKAFAESDAGQRVAAATDGLVGGLRAYTHTLAKSLGSIVADDTADHDAMILKSLEQFQEAVEGLVPDAIHKAFAAGMVADNAGAAGHSKEPAMAEITKAAHDTVVAANARLIGILKGSMSEDEMKYCKDAGMSDDAVADFMAMSKDERSKKMSTKKNHDPAFSELKKSHDDLAARLAKRDEADEIAVFAKRAAACGEGEAFGESLRAVAKAQGDAAANALETSMLAKNNQLKMSGLFTEVGKGQGPGAGSAAAEVASKAADIRKADSSITEAQAITKAYTADPALYDRVQREQRVAQRA